MAGDISRENGKKGGRPKGRKNLRTLTKERIKREIDNRIFHAAHKLYESQMTLARGISYLYRKDKKWIQKGNSGYWLDLPAVRVEDPDEIAMYLDGLLNSGDAGASYYYITAKDPNNNAIDSLKHDAFGKPKTEQIEFNPAYIVPIIIRQGEGRSLPPEPTTDYSVKVSTYAGEGSDPTS